MTPLLLFLIIVFWALFYRYRRRRMYQLASKIPPMPGTLPILGSVFSFIGDTEQIMNALKTLSYGCIERGGIVACWLGNIVFFSVTDPIDMEKVLKSCLDKEFIVHRFIRKAIGYGIIFAPVPVWRLRRKIMMPALSPKVVDSFVGIFAKQTNTLAEKLEPFCGTGSFSIWSAINRYALEAVCETALAVEIKAQDDPNVPFLTALNRITNLVSERIFQIWFQPDWLYRLFRGRHLEFEKCCETMRDFIDEVIAKKRKELALLEKSEPEKNHNNTVIDIYKDQSFLDLLIKSSGGDKGYNDVELREEILTLIIAGSDTSAVAISNTLVLLGKYPEIQDKVHHELSTVFGDSDRLLVKDDLPKLRYLECVIKESMRLFPPAPFLIRKAATETTLPSGHILPAKSGVIINIWGAHRDPKYWGPHAEHFDPDRFHPDRFHLPHPCCYLPFSNGPRNCVGYQYAIMSMKAALSAILRRYKTIGIPEKGPIPHIRMKFDIMMKDVDGYQVVLEKKEATSRGKNC